MKHPPAIIKTVVAGLLLLMIINSHRAKNIHSPSIYPIEANEILINQLSASLLPGSVPLKMTGNKEPDHFTFNQFGVQKLFSGLTETSPNSNKNSTSELSRGTARGTSFQQKPNSKNSFSAERKTGPVFFRSTLQPLDLIINPYEEDL